MSMPMGRSPLKLLWLPQKVTNGKLIVFLMLYTCTCMYILYPTLISLRLHLRRHFLLCISSLYLYLQIRNVFGSLISTRSSTRVHDIEHYPYDVNLYLWESKYAYLTCYIQHNILLCSLQSWLNIILAIDKQPFDWLVACVTLNLICTTVV